MPRVNEFEELDCWKQARELARQTYAVSGRGLFGRDFALRDQIRRAAISISSNIAEGFERDGSGEFGQFLSTAKGSTGEVRSQLHLALDQGYITATEHLELVTSTRQTANLIGGMMRYLRRSNLPGTKRITPPP